MNFGDLKLLYVFSCVVLGFIILSPTLMAFVPYKGGERFSELWIKGQDRIVEGYPFSVSEGELHSVFLGVGNHMGGLEYYTVYVKLRNQTEPLPDSAAALPSALEPVFEYRVFLINNQTWERKVSFSFEDVSFDGNASRVSGFSIDGCFVSVDKVAVWDSENSGFFYQLLFELWIYDSKTLDFTFHNRSVGLWLNMTHFS